MKGVCCKHGSGKHNAGFQAAPTRWSAGSRPAERTVALSSEGFESQCKPLYR